MLEFGRIDPAVEIGVGYRHRLGEIEIAETGSPLLAIGGPSLAAALPATFSAAGATATMPTAAAPATATAMPATASAATARRTRATTATAGNADFGHKDGLVIIDVVGIDLSVVPTIQHGKEAGGVLREFGPAQRAVMVGIGILEPRIRRIAAAALATERLAHWTDEKATALAIALPATMPAAVTTTTAMETVARGAVPKFGLLVSGATGRQQRQRSKEDKTH